MMPFCSTPALEKHPCSLHVHVPTSGGGRGSSQAASVLSSSTRNHVTCPATIYVQATVTNNTEQVQTADTNIPTFHPSVFTPNKIDLLLS